MVIEYKQVCGDEIYVQVYIIRYNLQCLFNFLFKLVIKYFIMLDVKIVLNQ